ncbi:type 1 glutamine amidotransferase [uncultured Pseudokineococcus sp.]|uniref:type 1 glutamine amidotransferase n=1 Tax=uncultured Pseudokineococcus sp. TaxID=1642928 RepID=UPI002606DC35|nr:type 1 glutamine amidotransferase [uncultured Pseudokineococcus sp.]
MRGGAAGAPAAERSGEEPLRVLVVQHEDVCPPALLGEALSAQGAVVDVVRPDLGQPLPASLGRRGPGVRAGGHDALVVLGGTAAADDDARWPWLPAVRALLAACAGDGTPVLGVCLGAQLLAAATGGRTGRAPLGPEHGLVPLVAEPVADPLLAAAAEEDGPWRAVQSHGDAVLELPPGATLLAASASCEVQVFRLARAWGVQYHPEATAEMVTAWCDAGDDARRELADAGLAVQDVVAPVAAAAPELARGADRHARVLLEQARAARRERGAGSALPTTAGAR